MPSASSPSTRRSSVLLTGQDFWSTTAIEKIGLRRIVFSDGPSGVRGEVWDERDPSLNLPSATALASSWDPESGPAVRSGGRGRGTP